MRGEHMLSMRWIAVAGLLALVPVHGQDGRAGGTPGAGRVGRRPRGAAGRSGVVSVAAGGPVEGIGVQLISARTAIRTTVYTNADGQFEFPVLEPGPYTLRVPRPMEFKPYVREGVQIAARTPLPEIALERVSATYLLPPTPEILAQLTGSEWMLNLSGTGEEKRVFTLGCGMGCHSYQQVFRNLYDEQGWELILQRMLRSGSSTLFGEPRADRDDDGPGWAADAGGRDALGEVAGAGAGARFHQRTLAVSAARARPFHARGGDRVRVAAGVARPP